VQGHTVLERDLGDDLLQLAVLASQILDFVAGRFAHSVSRKLLLPRLEKVLAPSVVEVRGDAFSPTQIRDALLASKPFEYDPNLLFGRELPSAPPTDLSYRCFSGLFLLVRHLDTLLGVTDPGMCLFP